MKTVEYTSTREATMAQYRGSFSMNAKRRPVGHLLARESHTQPLLCVLRR